MPAAKPGTDVVPFADYSLAKRDTSELMETIRENIGGGAITAFDLDRVKIPTGGGKLWSIPSIDGDPEDTRTIDGVIVYHREPRAFWKTAFASSGGGTPPDCSSQFGDFGVGEYGVGSVAHPSGDCKTCPMAEWGSAPLRDGQDKSRGQWCKQMKLTFVLRDDALLPLALFLPPTSLVPMRKYLLGLASHGQHYSSVVTRFTLDGATSDGGIDYSVVKPTRLESLDDASAARVREYSAAIRDVLDTIEITEADVISEESPSAPQSAPVDPEVQAAADALGGTVEGEWDGSEPL